MNKKEFKLKAFLIVLVVLTSCSSLIPPHNYYGVIIQRDDFNSNTIYRMHGNTLAGGSSWGGTGVNINLQLMVTDNGDSLLNIIAVYASMSWIFIQRGESLILLVDGERIAFSGEGSAAHRDVLTGAVVLEKAWYDITKEQINMILNAKEVRVKLTGRTLFIERHFGNNNTLRFKQFVDQYL